MGGTPCTGLPGVEPRTAPWDRIDCWEMTLEPIGVDEPDKGNDCAAGDSWSGEECQSRRRSASDAEKPGWAAVEVVATAQPQSSRPQQALRARIGDEITNSLAELGIT